MTTTTSHYSQRNISYLRVSPRIVLQAILYLDQRHLTWFNDALQNMDPDLEGERDVPRCRGDLIIKRVLRVLKTNIMGKLVREAPASDISQLGVMSKKERVDVHLDEDFQMAYFFKKVSHRHAVLLKEKHFSMDHLRSKRAAPVPGHQGAGLRSGAPATTTTKEEDDALAMPPPSKRPRTDAASSSSTGISNAPIDLSLDSIGNIPLKPDPDDLPTDPLNLLPPTSLEIKPGPADLEAAEAATFDLNFSSALENTIAENPPGSSQEFAFDLDGDTNEEEEEMDKKPRLKVRYSGFRIFAKQLIIVIEPTRSMRRSRPELFSISGGEERSRLSASAAPGQVGSTPVPGPGTGIRVGRSTPAAASAGGFRSTRARSTTGTRGHTSIDAEVGNSRVSASPAPHRGLNSDVDANADADASWRGGNWRGSATPAPRATPTPMPGAEESTRPSSSTLFRGPTPSASGLGGDDERELTPLGSQRDGAASRVLGNMLERERGGREVGVGGRGLNSQDPGGDRGREMEGGGRGESTPVRDVGLLEEEEEEEEDGATGRQPQVSIGRESSSNLAPELNDASRFIDEPRAGNDDTRLDEEDEEWDVGEEEFQRAEEVAMQMLEMQEAVGDGEKEVDGEGVRGF